MTTSITLDMVVAAFTKRNVPFKFYKSKADALTHNRNAAGANASVTPGGFGPLQGFGIHNFASDISDASSLAYLYTGDGPNSAKPGPLSQFAIDDSGVWWIIGWGAATHTGPGSNTTREKVRADQMPLDRDLLADGTKVAYNPFMLGEEMLYGKAPTPEQRDSLIRGVAAICELIGWTGGSLYMHREASTSRTDPIGFKGYEIRKAVNAQLAAWNAAPSGDFTVAQYEDLMAAIDKVNANVSGLRSEEKGRYGYYSAKFNASETLLRNLTVELTALSAALGGNDVEAFKAVAQKAFESALASTLKVTVDAQTPPPGA